MVRKNRSYGYALLSLVTFFQISNLYALAPKLPANYLPLPLVRQETNYSCGPASYLSLARYWDVYKGTESQLYPLMNTSEKDGTNPRNMLRVAIEMKLTARMEEKVTIEKLREAFAKGETVVLDLQAWKEDDKPWSETWEEGHYIVMSAIDGEYLYAMDPSVDEKYGYIPLKELYDRWHDHEVENGVPWKNYQLALFMKGAVPGKPLENTPELKKIE